MTAPISRFIDLILGNKKPLEKAAPEFGMTCGNEQSFCREYARDLFTGAGEIVDMGCWMGATTVSFSKGLRDNRRLAADQRRKRIHSYDLFTWHSSMDPNVRGTPLEGAFREGDSFLPEFEKRTSKWREYFSVNAGDVNAVEWTGGPIELLFVDAMKWPNTAAAIVKKFYPHLIPGVSLVAHQDFGHFFTGWIHLIQYRLRACFEVVHEVKKSSTVVFKLIAPIPPELLAQDCFPEHTDPVEIAAAFAYSASLVSKSMQERVAAAHAMTHLHRGEPALAKKVMLDFILANLGGYRFHERRSVMKEFYGEFQRHVVDASAQK